MIACFDIGGSAIKGAIAHSPEDIRPLPKVQTPLHDFDAFAGAIEKIAADGGADQASLISISIAGVVDADTGKITCANIPCIHGRKLVDDLSEKLHRPVLVANDADCFALSEAVVGAGRGHRVVFGVILGTGVGGGIVINGKIHEGAGGFAGEWGHGPVSATLAGNPPVAIPRLACGCGQIGCIDAIGAARGMEKLHAHLHGVNLPSTEIIERWNAGDTAAERTVDCYIDIVSGPLAMTINVVGASIVPVGGGLANSVPLIQRLDEAVRSRILRKTDKPLVVPAELKIEPGLIGAGVLGLMEVAK
ncbi:N-acetylglucosamine kinase [Phyllobacterium brassicacearum]|uniref:N-acetylglucosamine kinase n=1 Tax=Phyllobacterium brassicacearum TaxID=314235 RepID=A0A2P7BTN3_9HYPH|nr:ROK family protein [Phyllobacterium brassicacearum]PSH69838.1 N-acetylglucosamine kinase [Phyllobacterium brassicacearum]TDQ35002.1 N-acetylglucosamine kinase [Phyllobacterium brassicacearum]